MSTCVFIASSDNTLDVLRRVYPALERFWPDCPYPLFIGLNEAPLSFTSARAVRTSVAGWRAELLAQLEQLNHERLVLLLDDFLLTNRVDTRLVVQLVERAHAQQLDYLRLLPLDQAWLARLFRSSREDIEYIPACYPYFSSLQIAVWRRTHLCQMLAAGGSIWDFELQRLPGARHAATTLGAPIRYRHVVEKGQWMADAPRLLRRAGLSDDLGTRTREPESAVIRRLVRLALFQVVGYGVMRLRLALRAKADGG